MPLAVLLKAHVAKAKWEPILNVVPQYTGFHVSQPRNCSLVPRHQNFRTPAALLKNSPQGTHEKFGLGTRPRNWGRHWYAYIKRQWRLNILGILLLNTYQYQPLQVLSQQGNEGISCRHYFYCNVSIVTQSGLVAITMVTVFGLSRWDRLGVWVSLVSYSHL